MLGKWNNRARSRSASQSADRKELGTQTGLHEPNTAMSRLPQPRTQQRK